LVDHADVRRAGATVAVAVTVLAAGLALGISKGPTFAGWPMRAGFVAGSAVLAFMASWFGVKRLRRARTARPRLYRVGLAALLALTIAANVFILPRLYPAFHAGMALMALLLAGWLGESLGQRLPHHAVAVLALSLLGIAGAATPAALRELSNWDNVRMVYGNHAPTLTFAVQLASRSVPAHATAADSASSIAISEKNNPPFHLDWRGRDIVILSVDALRADHLGAYGYKRRVSPHIDELARQGVVFERAYTAFPQTSYAVTSLMTGKYVRPLVGHNIDHGADTLAGLCRAHGYFTAAFYPPSVFSVDRTELKLFEREDLGFEHTRVEFATGEYRLGQLQHFLTNDDDRSRRMLLWVHISEPHEPYSVHEGYDFGSSDIDRYDSEVAKSDDLVGQAVRAVREVRSNTVLIVTSDHGEEFGDHGGVFHGSTVYEEQVRVPLLVVAHGLEPRRVQEPVQLIDLMPTLLRAARITVPARVRGNDLGPWLVGAGRGEGFAFAESLDQALLAEGSFRLVCERKVDACALYDLREDAAQKRDGTVKAPSRAQQMRTRLRSLEASMATVELAGARMEGRALPVALMRAMAGDVAAADEVALLLDDADVVIRRKAAEVLLDARRPSTAAALRLARDRDEDSWVRDWSTLALLRLGEPPHDVEALLRKEDKTYRRLAALVLAERGDPRGQQELVAWWAEGGMGFERAIQVAAVLGSLRARSAVDPLIRSLEHLRIRPYVADALAAIGDERASPALLAYFEREPDEFARPFLARAIARLGASRELAAPLTRYLGLEVPMPEALDIAIEAGITVQVGAPSPRQLENLRGASGKAMLVHLSVPRGGNGQGLRVVAKAKRSGDRAAQLRVGLARAGAGGPAMLPGSVVPLPVDAEQWQIVHAHLPAGLHARPGSHLRLVVAIDQVVQVEALAVVPLADALPAVPGVPWNHEPTARRAAPP
ncbi:MAG: sulfatase-like hydrolase/transferase, partial [Polyangiaceae bacterium]|nr:sulfatase-like hydrolase/transferase [Polyangiaceae bacterium]